MQLIGTAFLFFEAKAEAGLKYGPKGRGVVLLPRKMRKTGTENTAQEKRHKFAAEKRGLYTLQPFSQWSNISFCLALTGRNGSILNTRRRLYNKTKDSPSTQHESINPKYLLVPPNLLLVLHDPFSESSLLVVLILCYEGPWIHGSWSKQPYYVKSPIYKVLLRQSKGVIDVMLG